MPTASQAQATKNAPAEPRAAKVKRKPPLETGLKKLKGKDIASMSGTEREKLEDDLARTVAAEMKEQQRQDEAAANTAPEPRALDAGELKAPPPPAAASSTKDASDSDAAGSEDDELRREMEEEDAAFEAEERDIAVMDTGVGSRIAGAVSSVGLESGLGSDDSTSKVYDEKTGMYTDREPDAGWSLTSGEREDDEGETSSFGLESDGRNVKASQEGLLQNADGEDIIGSLSVGKDGVEVEGLELTDGWKLDFKAGPDEQKIGFQAPAELKFPPPDGFEQDFLDLAFPVFPGVSFEVESGVEGGVELGGLNGFILHRTTKEGDDPYEQVSHWEITGGGEISSELGVFLSIALVGGVPSIVALKTGLQASAGAEASMAAKLGGSLDITQTVPVAGEKPKELGRTGEFKLELDGGGSVGASFGAFVSVEVLTFEQELWSIDFIKVPIADLDLGGQLGAFWNGNKTTFEWKPAYGKHGADFDWLFKSYFKARRLDKAKEKATDTKAESKNIKELKRKAQAARGADGEPLSVKELLSDPANDTLIVNAEVQKLITEEQKLVALDEADRKSLTKLEERIVALTKKNEETKKKRWKLTNFIRGDIKELDKANAAKKTLEKNLVKYEKDLAALDPKMKAARAKFIEGLEGKDIDALILAAREKKHEARRENYALYLSELESEKAEYEKNTTEADKVIGELETKRDDLDARIASFTSGDGKGDVALHGRKEKELKAAKEAAEKPYVALKKQIEEVSTRTTGLEEKQRTTDADKGHTGFFGFFKKAVAGGDDPELKQARSELSTLKKQEKKLEKVYEKAATTYETHVRANPITELNRKLSSIQDELKQRKKGRMRLENRWLDKQRELRLIMLGEYGKEMDEQKAQAKMAKYAVQYGEKKQDDKAKVA
jgi:hypothetical protein